MNNPKILVEDLLRLVRWVPFPLYAYVCVQQPNFPHMCGDMNSKLEYHKIENGIKSLDSPP